MAKQANGSVLLKCKDTVLLATATMSKTPKENIDFFPLTIEFSEKMYDFDGLNEVIGTKELLAQGKKYE